MEYIFSAIGFICFVVAVFLVIKRDNSSFKKSLDLGLKLQGEWKQKDALITSHNGSIAEIRGQQKKYLNEVQALRDLYEKLHESHMQLRERIADKRTLVKVVLPVEFTDQAKKARKQIKEHAL